ncbi:MAG: succinylglutamate desuccinylase [Rhodospirillaceae bacterium]|nr:succinylglutamate desuccinylase [Rhodospirillaceae bacterium]
MAPNAPSTPPETAVNSVVTHPVELSSPDIEPYKSGNSGVEYFTTFDSGKTGPHALITAVTHGNELCGAIALDLLFRRELRPKRGQLTFGFCNVEAYQSFDPRYPTLSRFIDEDLNRVWAQDVLDGDRDTAETRRARQIRPLLETVDFLLDIHSMQNDTTPLMLCGPLDKGRAFAKSLGYPEYIVSDEGHAAGKRMRDYGGFSEATDPRNALLVECGQHWAKGSDEVALESALRFLLAIDLVDPDTVASLLMTEAEPAQKLIEITHAITVETDDFEFAGDFSGMEMIAKAGSPLARDGDRSITTPHDDCVLIMPSRRLGKGQTAVRLGRLIG